MSDHAQQPAPAPAGHEFRFDSAGMSLFAVEHGAGRPILMLHGGLANHLAALMIVGPLIPRFRIITPDLRASGKSVYTGQLSWDQLADDAAALMTHLGIDRAVVGGASMGSGVALRFALKYPERTAGVLLVQPVYPGEDRGLTEPQAATFRVMDAHGSRAIDEGVQVLNPLFQGLPSPIREGALAMVAGFDAASVAATTRFIASGAQPIASAAELRAITAPALIVPGNDPLHPADVAALYARNIPGCTVRQAPIEAVASAISDFCEQLPAW